MTLQVAEIFAFIAAYAEGEMLPEAAWCFTIFAIELTSLEP